MNTLTFLISLAVAVVVVVVVVMVVGCSESSCVAGLFLGGVME